MFSLLLKELIFYFYLNHGKKIRVCKIRFVSIGENRIFTSADKSYLTYPYPTRGIDKPEDHWSCIAHLSAEDMLKSAVIEKRSLNLALRQGQTTH